MKKILFIALAGSLMMVSCKRKGCMDPLADNYDYRAEKDIGTCTYVTNPWAPNNPNNPNPGGGNPGTSQTIEWTSNITTPTTIAPNTLVKVCQNISVSSKLILSEGVVLEFCSGRGLDILANGSITANGTASKSVILKGAVNTAGFWAGLSIKSNNPDNVLNYTIIKDGGSSSYYDHTNIYLSANAQLKMTNSTLASSSGYGLRATPTSKLVGFENNKFEANVKEGLSIDFIHVGSLDQGSNYNLNNGQPNIEVRGGAVSTNMIVKSLNTPYIVTDEIKIHGAVEIQPGAKFLFTANTNLLVSENGSINAIGNASEKISFKGVTSAAGFWKGIQILSNSPLNVFDNVEVKDGGSSSYYYSSGIYLKGALSIDNSVVTNSNNYGIWVIAGNTIKTNGTAQTTQAGVAANNSLTGNGAGSAANCTDGCMVKFY